VIEDGAPAPRNRRSWTDAENLGKRVEAAARLPPVGGPRVGAWPETRRSARPQRGWRVRDDRADPRSAAISSKSSRTTSWSKTNANQFAGSSSRGTEQRPDRTDRRAWRGIGPFVRRLTGDDRISYVDIQRDPYRRPLASAAVQDRMRQPSQTIPQLQTPTYIGAGQSDPGFLDGVLRFAGRTSCDTRPPHGRPVLLNCSAGDVQGWASVTFLLRRAVIVLTERRRDVTGSAAKEK